MLIKHLYLQSVYKGCSVYHRAVTYLVNCDGTIFCFDCVINSNKESHSNLCVRLIRKSICFSLSFIYNSPFCRLNIQWLKIDSPFLIYICILYYMCSGVFKVFSSKKQEENLQMNMTTKSPASGKVDTSNMKHTPILIALLLGAMVALLNETLLGNALTVLMKEFGVTASTIQWLSTAYMLVVGVLVPITALLQQWLTTRQMFFRYGNVFSWYINCGICADIFCFISRPYRPSCSDGINYTVINEYDFNHLST